MLWYLDSGAPAHMTGNRDWFDDYKPLDNFQPVKIGNGEFINAVGIGSILTTSVVDDKQYNIRLHNVRYVPKISDNLFSVGSADDAGAEVRIKDGSVTVLDRDEVILKGHKVSDKLYKLDMTIALKANISRTDRTAQEWHDVLGHADVIQVEKMAKSGCVTGMNIVKQSKGIEGCNACQLGKGKCSSPLLVSRTRNRSLRQGPHGHGRTDTASQPRRLTVLPAHEK